MTTPPQCLAIVTHVAHYRIGETLYAYEPYAREIEIWADLFPRLLIAAPLHPGPPAAMSALIARPNIEIAPQPQTGGDGLAATLAQLAALPRLLRSLGRALRRADAIHVRCPGNLGLLGILLAPRYTPYRIAKYAGQWTGYPGEAWTYKLQRALLRSRYWGAPTTVYGRWPGQPATVVPFFTSVLDSGHMARARRAAARRSDQPLRRLLYVGRLTPAKNVHTILDAAAQLGRAGFELEVVIAGEGPEHDSLVQRTADLGLEVRVTFTGGIPFEQVLELYETCDVLVLVSETEGWPKAITEAMAFGLVAIGAVRGLVPEILGEGRGLTVPPGDASALATALERLLADPAAARTMAAKAADWAQRHSLDDLREALRDLLATRWRIPRTALSAADEGASP